MPTRAAIDGNAATIGGRTTEDRALDDDGST